MKPRFIAAAIASLAILVSCEGFFDFDEPSMEDDTTVPILDGNTLTYGDHHYTLDETATSAEVTFTHFPATVREFQTLQNQLLGKSQPGTLALDLMAFEMFRRDRTKGKKCIEMCNLSVNTKQILERLGERFPEKRTDPVSNSYQQPYLVASFLKGATQENKYQPEYPYRLAFSVSTNSNKQQGEHSLTFFGHIYYWNTTRAGLKDYDASVIVLDEDDTILVHGCSNYYLGAPDISSWEDTLL